MKLAVEQDGHLPSYASAHIEAMEAAEETMRIKDACSYTLELTSVKLVYRLHDQQHHEWCFVFELEME